MNLPVKDIIYLQNKIAYARDQQAYKQLFHHFYAPLHRLAYGVTGDFELAEEIVSDIMMKVWDMGNKLAQIDKLHLYLFTAVKNACNSHFTKKSLQVVSVSNSANENELISNTSETQTPESILLTSELQCKIDTVIRELSPQCSMVFRLIKEEGLSHKEVSTILEISQNTIETHMRRALKKVRHLLQDYLVIK